MKTQNNPSIPNGKFQAASKPTSHSVGQALWESGLGVEAEKRSSLKEYASPFPSPIRIKKKTVEFSFS